MGSGSAVLTWLGCLRQLLRGTHYHLGCPLFSTLDVKVVLKTIVDRAVDLSGTDAGSIFYYRPEVGRFELGETAGIGKDIIIRLRKLDIAVKDSGLGEAIALRRPLLIPDLTKR